MNWDGGDPTEQVWRKGSISTPSEGEVSEMRVEMCVVRSGYLGPELRVKPSGYPGAICRFGT